MAEPVRTLRERQYIAAREKYEKFTAQEIDVRLGGLLPDALRDVILERLSRLEQLERK